MLTCSLGDPHTPNRQQAPQDQATPLHTTSHFTLSFLFSLVVLCDKSKQGRCPGKGRASAPTATGRQSHSQRGTGARSTARRATLLPLSTLISTKSMPPH